MKQQRGFTIVELLIVIVVIAILAAITIIAYNGIRQRTIESSMKTDLQNGITALEMDKTLTGTYPWDAGEANSGKGLKASGENQLTYLGGTNSFCLLISNPQLPTTYYINSETRQATAGSCGIFATTLAGTPTSGMANGTGLAARFDLPTDVALDSSGNLYVADSGNNLIRRVTPVGVVSTYAGTGTAGGANHATDPLLAQFDNPVGITVDSANNVYVTERDGHRVRKITPAGAVTTLAGTGVAGNTDNTTGTLAQLNRPSDVVVNAAGEVFVSDSGNRRIRKITTGGAVEPFAGSLTNVAGDTNGTGSAALFRGPWGMTIDPSGNVYVVEDSGHRVRRITPGAVVTTIAGTGTSGYSNNTTGTSAQFSYPQGIGIDGGGNLYIADSNNGYIRKIALSGSNAVTTVAGDGQQGDVDGPGPIVRFRYPWGLTADASGTMYVADTYGHRIRKVVQ